MIGSMKRLSVSLGLSSAFAFAAPVSLTLNLLCGGNGHGEGLGSHHFDVGALKLNLKMFTGKLGSGKKRQESAGEFFKRAMELKVKQEREKTDRDQKYQGEIEAYLLALKKLRKLSKANSRAKANAGVNGDGYDDYRSRQEALLKEVILKTRAQMRLKYDASPVEIAAAQQATHALRLQWNEKILEMLPRNAQQPQATPAIINATMPDPFFAEFKVNENDTNKSESKKRKRPEVAVPVVVVGEEGQGGTETENDEVQKRAMKMMRNNYEQVRASKLEGEIDACKSALADLQWAGIAEADFSDDSLSHGVDVWSWGWAGNWSMLRSKQEQIIKKMISMTQAQIDSISGETQSQTSRSELITEWNDIIVKFQIETKKNMDPALRHTPFLYPVFAQSSDGSRRCGTPILMTKMPEFFEYYGP